MQIQDLYSTFLQYPTVQTDSRKVKTGDLFFALKGENFNGNFFAKQALDAGAAYAIIDESKNFEDARLIKVDDVLSTLQQLAKFHREQFSIPVIAVTGSNGKTTTKELIHEVLTTTYKTYTTKGNLNNHIGIPLTLLSIKKDAEIVVIEMGANHQKEIEGYCKYTQPTHGIITNIGKAHLEGFGGEEGVIKGKGELFEYLKMHNGIAFVNNDSEVLVEISKGIKTKFTYGTKDADTIGILLENTGDFIGVHFTRGNTIKNIHTHLVGTYNLPNVLAAAAIGTYFKVADEKIKIALENYIPSNSRSQMIEKDSNKIILDAYNANPSSMKAAIENFARLNGEHKVLMLGGMMELGKESMAEHESVIKLIQSYPVWKSVVLVGGDFQLIKNPFINFKNSSEAKEWYREQHFFGAQILIKGSRSIQMEKVIEN